MVQVMQLSAHCNLDANGLPGGTCQKAHAGSDRLALLAAAAGMPIRGANPPERRRHLLSDRSLTHTLEDRTCRPLLRSNQGGSGPHTAVREHTACLVSLPQPEPRSIGWACAGAAMCSAGAPERMFGPMSGEGRLCTAQSHTCRAPLGCTCCSWPRTAPRKHTACPVRHITDWL